MEESDTARTADIGNTEEDWRIYEILCKDIKMESDDIDLTTNLRSEVAGLQFKRDRLTQELNEMKCQMRSREQRCVELQMETDQLREQTARQNAVICSLKKRIHELEEHERELYATQGRNEIAIQSFQRDNKYHEDKIKEMEKRLHCMEMELSAEEQKKDAARHSYHDLVRRMSTALGVDSCDGHFVADNIVHKATELVQEASRLRNRAHNMNENLNGIELELRNCKESLDNAIADKECLQRQSASQLLELDRLRQDKENLEMHNRVMERELNELREKLACSTRSLGNATGNIAQQEATICQLRDELKIREEKCQRLQHENRHILESISISISCPNRFVEATECEIKERLREILTDSKDKAAQIESLREKLNHDSHELSRHIAITEEAQARIHELEEIKNHLEARLHKADAEISACELSREGLKRDKCTFVQFLERLARALNMEDISHEIGVDMHTESILLRAEQLSRLESEKLVDKLGCRSGPLPRLRRERTCHELAMRETALVYQLQRRVRTLREQIQRKDLHLDLLRRKLALHEDAAKAKCILQGERDEANCRAKKLMKQVERLQMQLSELKSQCRDLNAQLAEAADYKITALERGRKIEELQKRLIESETLRTKYNRKVSMLKDQVRSTGETIEQERSMNEHSMHMLRDELTRLKETLSELNRREAQLQSFKNSIAKILGAPLPIPDYELISRLQKLVDAHHDFTLVSRRYDDPVLRLTSRSPTGGGGAGSRCTRTPDRSRYDDSGYTDAVIDIDDIEEDLYKARPPRGPPPL